MTETKDSVLDTKTDGEPLLVVEGTTGEEGEEQVDPVKAAGITGALVGLLGGPIGSVVGGFTAMYAAEHKEGPVGNAARKLGQYGLYAKQKMTNMASKYHVSERSTELYASAQAYDTPKILDTTTNMALKGWQSTTQFCQEKQVVQKGKVYIGKNVCYLLEKVVGGKDKEEDAPVEEAATAEP